MITMERREECDETRIIFAALLGATTPTIHVVEQTVSFRPSAFGGAEDHFH